MLKELKIADIKMGSRHRKDMGDLTSLAESIRQEGLPQPIGVTEKLDLVLGEGRIRATEDILKKKTILARIMDITNIPAGGTPRTRCGRISCRPSGSLLPKPSNVRSETARGRGRTGNLCKKLHKLSRTGRPVTPPPSVPGSATTELTGKPPRWSRSARPRSSC